LDTQAIHSIACVSDLRIGCRSLTIHRVESALSTESCLWVLAQAKAFEKHRAVDNFRLRQQTSAQIELEERHNAKYSKEPTSVDVGSSVLDDASTMRRQSYRVK
jgi:hypothetical protein